MVRNSSASSSEASGPSGAPKRRRSSAKSAESQQAVEKSASRSERRARDSSPRGKQQARVDPAQVSSYAIRVVRSENGRGVHSVVPLGAQGFRRFRAEGGLPAFAVMNSHGPGTYVLEAVLFDGTRVLVDEYALPVSKPVDPGQNCPVGSEKPPKLIGDRRSMVTFQLTLLVPELLNLDYVPPGTLEVLDDIVTTIMERWSVLTGLTPEVQEAAVRSLVRERLPELNLPLVHVAPPRRGSWGLYPGWP